MGIFKYHAGCPNCGSSDGRAVYSDGSSFCFVCHKSAGGTVSPYIVEKQDRKRSLGLPDDICTEYPEHVLNWVFKYGITIPELIKHNVYYSRFYDQLIFTWYADSDNAATNGSRTPVLWQGRNFRADAKAKCFTSGNPNDCLPLYEPVVDDVRVCTSPSLVLVEDPISALKCARLTTSMPILGSSLSPNKLMRLAALPEASMGILVWLDGNMWHKSQMMAERLQLLGCKAKSVYTELDPKEYTDEEIKCIIQN